MKRVILALAMACALSGCASLLDGVFDDQAVRQCEQETRPSELGGCIDRVEQHRRERD